MSKDNCNCNGCARNRKGLGGYQPCERYAKDAIPKPPKPPGPRIIKPGKTTLDDGLAVIIPLLVGVIVGLAFAPMTCG